MEEPLEAPAGPPAAPAVSRLGLVVAAAIGVLAVVETAVAVVAPSRAPQDADWEAAAREIRAAFAPGDLIVAAPAWADPLMRLHLGDLVPLPVAARLDDARFGRVWELGQRGAHAPEAARGAVALEKRFGALTLRRVDRPPAVIVHDLLEHWTEARVSRRTPGRPDVQCPWNGDRFQCPDVSFNFVRLQTVEVDTRVHRGLLAQPVGHATVVIEYPAVPLGKELVVATGLHDVWMRKAGHGAVDLRVVVAGTPQGAIEATNDTGWQLTHIDTSAYAGRVVDVRFEITSAEPFQRHFVLAAEARR
ncbi:MAG TPA: hypothetical protein VHL80_02345 [Polyangia bacterium]|nr:hypothetical protein [Polyangia bacterium]